MNQLTDTQEDRKLLHELLSGSKPVKARITTYCFASPLATILTKLQYTGEVTEIDLESGYCRWRHEKGCQMQPIKINCIAII